VGDISKDKMQHSFGCGKNFNPSCTCRTSKKKPKKFGDPKKHMGLLLCLWGNIRSEEVAERSTNLEQKYMRGDLDVEAAFSAE
jgi:hypothetical protein